MTIAYLRIDAIRLACSVVCHPQIAYQSRLAGCIEFFGRMPKLKFEFDELSFRYSAISCSPNSFVLVRLNFHTSAVRFTTQETFPWRAPYALLAQIYVITAIDLLGSIRA